MCCKCLSIDREADNQSNVYVYHAMYTNGSKHGNIVDSIIQCGILRKRYMVAFSSCQHCFLPYSDRIPPQRYGSNSNISNVYIHICLTYLVSASVLLSWGTTVCTGSYWWYVMGDCSAVRMYVCIPPTKTMICKSESLNLKTNLHRKQFN